MPSFAATMWLVAGSTRSWLALANSTRSIGPGDSSSARRAAATARSEASQPVGPHVHGVDPGHPVDQTGRQLEPRVARAQPSLCLGGAAGRLGQIHTEPGHSSGNTTGGTTGRTTSGTTGSTTGRHGHEREPIGGCEPIGPPDRRLRSTREEPGSRSATVRAFLIASAALALAFGPAAVASADPPHEVPAVAAYGSGTSDFTFDSFDVVYDLGLTGDGRSTATVTETLVAEFPDFDQNHGILRVIPVVYDGHPTRLHVQSVRNANGGDWNYESNVDSENITLQIGDGDIYVHGQQTYVITYTMENVTRYFADTNDDEFYWDTNGLQWGQPFGEVTATVNLDDGLANSLQSTDCYFGSAGQADGCEISDGADGTVTARASEVAPYQNMTIALGFPSGTFAAADFSIFDYLPVGGIVGILGTIGAALSALVLRFTKLRDAAGTGIVIAQYEPPENMDPFLAANIVKAPKRGMAAAIMDLAVKRKLRIVERPGGGLFGGTDFGVQQVDPDSGASKLSGSEVTVMDALFSPFGGRFFSLRTPGLITIGNATATQTPAADVKWLKKNDTVLGRQVVALTKAAATEAQRSGLRKKGGGAASLLVIAFIVIGGLGFLASSVASQTEIAIAVGVIGINAIIWIGIGLVAIVVGRKPLTTEGAKLKEHLLGLREYIRLAEADRLQMLQSVTGAERAPIAGTTDNAQIVKVYEKLLPYAVLFGLEKEWAGELGKYYDQNPPDWYDGGNVNAFNAGAFAAGVGSISSSVASSFSGSSSSSSSGGSGGGGSSGGGGGGGGGGGW